jgi:hypothetical protein
MSGHRSHQKPGLFHLTYAGLQEPNTTARGDWKETTKSFVSEEEYGLV